MPRLVPDLLDEIAETENLLAEIETSLAEAQPTDDEEENGDGSDDREGLSEEEQKALKKERTALRKQVKTLHKGFVEHLRAAAADALEPPAARTLVLEILKAELIEEVDQRVIAQRQAVVRAFETWWDKYRTTLREIEAERDAAKAKLDGFLTELGYG